MNYCFTKKESASPLGELFKHKTNDGSLSLYSNDFQESFHSKSGAFDEATNKFLIPAELDRFRPGEKLFVLDICVGLGYNSALIFEEARKRSIKLEWWGLEIDSRPLKIALNEPEFTKNWSPNVIAILKEIHKQGFWDFGNSKGKLLWGDARHQLENIPRTIKADLILLDAFSPNHCPELWSNEFLKSISLKLAPQGRLLTYCTAAAVRNCLRGAGLDLYSLKTSNHSRNWSLGTMACLPNNNTDINKKKSFSWQSLSQMEEEHLITRAAIPYRDPNKSDNSKAILKRRRTEQNTCDLEATSAWKKRWGLGKKP